MTSGFMQEFYNVPKLAATPHVHENTIYGLIRARRIGGHEAGHRIRVAAAELERLKVERIKDDEDWEGAR